jgi:hypothetical protein
VAVGPFDDHTLIRARGGRGNGGGGGGSGGGLGHGVRGRGVEILWRSEVGAFTDFFDISGMRYFRKIAETRMKL